MGKVNFTELRRKLPADIEQVRKGGELRVSVRGKVVARIVPAADERDAARRRLLGLREREKVGDVISPLGEARGRRP